MATAQDKKELIDKFREVTGVDEERAKFYLEAANWHVDVATGSFFEGNDSMDEGPGEEGGSARTTAIPTQPHVPSPMAVRSGGIPLPRSGPMTLDALRSTETDSSDDDDHQAFYAGGSESSGQQVLGPPRNRDELIAEMFKKAREMGAQEAPQMFKKKERNNESFGGAGYKLGDDKPSSSTSVSKGAGAATGSSSSSEVQDVVLHLWSNGFTVDDGPLRSYRDPQNLSFLDAVKRGEVPAELRQSLKGQDCSLSIMDQRGEDYSPPKSSTAVSAFTGKGHMLGSPAPVVVPSTPASVDERKTNEDAARSNIQLSPGQPTTSIQFRLLDGSRLAAQFNHTHTVQDLYGFINMARPEYSSTNYVLTLFPSTELTNKSANLKEANILNSALIQKIK